MYLLDSDYLIDFLNGREKTVTIIKNLRRQGLNTSIICIAEVLEGLYFTKNEERVLQFEEFVRTINVIEINRKVANHFALIRGRLRTKGKLIDNFDLLIAATCLAYDLTLTTNNISHFKRIPNLKIYLP